MELRLVGSEMCIRDSYSINWSPATGLSSTTVANPMASPSTITTYTITVTDSLGCEATDIVTVDVSPEIIVDAGFPSNVCLGDTAVLGGTPTATGGTPGYIYQWSPAAGLNFTDVPNPSAYPIATTVYTVTVTDGANCSASDDVTVFILPNPVADAGAVSYTHLTLPTMLWV